MTQNCCVCLCVYNNERGLPAVLNNANKLSVLFKSLKILVFYDHSSDNSLQILNIYNNNFNNMDIKINEKKVSGSSVVNIAYARNGLLQMIKDKYSDYEYFIMMYSNEYSCVGSINIHVISEMLERNDWDSVSFDREAGYYDYWALSYDPFIYSFHHFNTYDFGSLQKKMCDDFLKRLALYRNHEATQLMPVYSAFNGCALYKTSKFLNCKYSSIIDLNLFDTTMLQKNEELFGTTRSIKMDDDCEHRYFHLESIMKNNAKIRICTKSLFQKVKNPPANLRGSC